MNLDLAEIKIIKKKKAKNKKADASAWALSYGDMVTALLCFFILFYALEKQVEKKRSDQESELLDPKAKIEEHASSSITANYDYAIASIQETPGIIVKKTSSFVDITFSQTVFFEKGQTELSQEGKKQIEEVIKKLKKIEGKYILEIQGHADPTPVMNLKSRWWQNNMELSVLRALTVHTYLAENYIEKNNLIVSGYGSQQKLELDSEKKTDMNRRISLRLQLVK
jgi:chemotaxis protein MotB